MKVVLFCGGLGMRLRDHTHGIPKPMVCVGNRPILWHVMKYYAHFGHRDFILCLGYKSDVIKDYFLSYNECLSNDFVLSQGGKKIELRHSDIQDWTITFADTGSLSNIGQRLKAVQKYLRREEMFLANYSDGLTDMPLDQYIDAFIRRGKIAAFLCIKPRQSYHVVSFESDETTVNGIAPMTNASIWMNGGYFAFRKEIFDYIGDKDELVTDSFTRLIDRKLLMAHKYSGYWGCMDTFKEKQQLDDLYLRGEAPWEVWRNHVNDMPRGPRTLTQHIAEGHPEPQLV